MGDANSSASPKGKPGRASSGPLPTKSSSKVRSFLWLRDEFVASLRSIVVRCAKIARSVLHTLFYPNAWGTLRTPKNTTTKRSESESSMSRTPSATSVVTTVQSSDAPRGDPLLRAIGELAIDVLRPATRSTIAPQQNQDGGVVGANLTSFSLLSQFLSPALAPLDQTLRHTQSKTALQAPLSLVDFNRQVAGQSESDLRLRGVDFINQWIEHSELRSQDIYRFVQLATKITNCTLDFERVALLRDSEQLFVELWTDNAQMCKRLEAQQPELLEDFSVSIQTYSEQIGPVLDMAFLKIMPVAAKTALTNLWALVERKPNQQVFDIQRQLAGQTAFSFAALGLSDEEGLELAKILPLQALCITQPVLPQTPHQFWLTLVSTLYRITWSSLFIKSKNQLIENGTFLKELREGKAIGPALTQQFNLHWALCAVMIFALHTAHRLSYSDVGQKLGWGTLGWMAGSMAGDDINALVEHVFQQTAWTAWFIPAVACCTYLLSPLMAYLSVAHRDTPVWQIAQLERLERLKNHIVDGFVQWRDQDQWNGRGASRVEITEIIDQPPNVAEIGQSADDSV